MIGKTGSGKSSLGNTLTGEMLFPDSRNVQTLSNRAESKFVQAKNNRFGRWISVIDTPGIFDTRFSSESIMYKLRRGIALTTPGPHAMILTVKASRFTKEDMEVFKTYIDLFGESMLKYTVVVFTHFDHWKHIEGKTRDEAIEDFIKSFPETLNQFLKRIENRYIMVDTKGEDVEAETEALTFAIKQMITDNKNDFYSYQHFIDSSKSQLKAEGVFADENRRQTKMKNKRKLTSRFLKKTIKRKRSSFERETDAWMVPLSKRRYNRRA